MKPTMGQIVYSLNVRNAARGCPQILTKCVVTKVGNKYFTVKNERGYGETQYHINSWKEKTEYSASSRLYASEQEYLDEKEAKELCDVIAKAFEFRNTPKPSLAGLRKIVDIIRGTSQSQSQVSNEASVDRAREVLQELTECTELLMQWCIKNIDRWSFPQYDWTHKAVDKAKDILALQSLPAQDAKAQEDATFGLIEAAEVVLSNEEHAFSGGMRNYQKGSQTWEAYNDLKLALQGMQTGSGE